MILPALPPNFLMTIWAVFEIPFVGLVLLAIGLGIGQIFGKIKNGPLAATLTVLVNGFVSCLLLRDFL